MEITQFKKENAQSENNEIAPMPNTHSKQIAHSINPRPYPYPRLSGLLLKMVSLLDKQ